MSQPFSRPFAPSCRRRNAFRRFGQALLFGATVAVGSTLASDTPAPNPEPWQAITRLKYTQAVDLFRQSSDDTSQLGLAIALLNAQPVTQARTDEAAQLLQRLCESSNADTAANATYFLARLETLHRHPPAFDKALALYDDLIAQHPRHVLAQQAVAKAGAIRIFNAPASDLQTTYARVAAQASTLTDTDARRDFHLMLADAATLLKLPDADILQHLLAANDVGISRRKNQADILIRIARTAERAGRTDLTRRYYNEFLTTFGRDPRAYYVRMQLDALKSPEVR